MTLRYADGREIKPGDTVKIDDRYRGRVLANMSAKTYLPGQEAWSYLKDGVLIDTDFGGCVHYSSSTTEKIELLSRASEVSDPDR
jgi:hypothetical protein